MNYLLDSSNAAIASVTFMSSTLAGPKGNVSLDGVPLGLVNGEIAVKVTGTGGGGVPTTPPTVTPNFFAPASTTPVVIPVGAVNTTVIILTGTGTLNGIDQPLGVPWTEPNKLAATVTLVLGSPGTARVYYGT